MSYVTGISGINLSAAFAAYAPTNSADVSAIASAYATGKQDALTFGYDAEDKISSIDGSAIAGGAGGIDSATCSAIASAYAESAVSAVSGDYYSTSNPSSFITGVDLSPYATTAYVDSSVSSKADSSALTSYALSSDVSGTVDLVSTQSANWGGSALQLSAGTGIKLEKVGDTLVASTTALDTLLFVAPANTQVASATLSENAENFECLDIYMQGYGVSQKPVVLRVVADNSNTAVQVNWSLGNNTWYLVCQKLTISGTSISIANAHAIHGSTFTSTDIIHESNTSTISNTIVKVVGINRKAGA